MLVGYVECVLYFEVVMSWYSVVLFVFSLSGLSVIEVDWWWQGAKGLQPSGAGWMQRHSFGDQYAGSRFVISLRGCIDVEGQYYSEMFFDSGICQKIGEKDRHSRAWIGVTFQVVFAFQKLCLRANEP